MARNWLSCPPNSIPFVSVHIGVDRYSALIDPGSFVSFVSPELSMTLGLPKHGYQRVVSVHGDNRLYHVVTLPTVSVADLEITSCKAAISNLNPIKKGLDLLLGVNAFNNRRLQIDFKEGRVYIFPER